MCPELFYTILPGGTLPGAGSGTYYFKAMLSAIPGPDRLAELYRYRELIYNLVARDLKVRYKNSVIGVFWSLLNPLVMSAIFTFVFTVLMPSGLPNYALYVLIGLLAWNWTVGAVVGGAQSIVSHGHLVRKVYFPTEVLPISTVLSNLINFMFALVPLFGLMLVLGQVPGPQLVLLPLAILTQLIFLSGLALAASALNVPFRDTAAVLDVLMLGWFFLTPVFYRVEDLAGGWSRLMYIVNPLASIIANYRVLLYYNTWPDPLFMLRTLAQALLVLAAGYLVFSLLRDRLPEEV
jgi:ABC-type polysaccharide/polyol phosphate export permease